MKGLIIALALASSLSAVDVILDPGHGGTDAGASGPSYLEKNANLDVAFQAKSYLEAASVTVGMTRSTDMTLSLADRCAIANSGGWERFMSMHENAYNTAVQGTETYCYGSGSSNSFDMRNKVHPELIWAHGYDDRGTKTANYYVLVNTTMPAILGEGTFIDYTAGWDESWRYLTNWNDHKGRQGFAYAKGFCVHRGITPPTYGSPPTTDSIIVDNDDPEFTSGGSWSLGTYSGGWESDYLFCNISGSNWARWSPDLPEDGEYDVYMWWLAGANRCDSVFVRVFGLANDSMTISQKGTGSEWHYLGSHEFYEGTSGYVSLGDRTAVNGDVVIADAVLWIYNAPLGTDDFAAPAKPQAISLSAHPNPFNSAVTITLDGVGAGLAPALVEVFDLNGRMVDNLSVGATRRVARSTGQPPVDPYECVWQPALSVGSGVYLVRARFDDPRSLSGGYRAEPRQAPATGTVAATKRVVYLK